MLDAVRHRHRARVPTDDDAKEEAKEQKELHQSQVQTTRSVGEDAATDSNDIKLASGDREASVEARVGGVDPSARANAATASGLSRPLRADSTAAAAAAAAAVNRSSNTNGNSGEFVTLDLGVTARQRAAQHRRGGVGDSRVNLVDLGEFTVSQNEGKAGGSKQGSESCFWETYELTSYVEVTN